MYPALLSLGTTVLQWLACSPSRNPTYHYCSFQTTIMFNTAEVFQLQKLDVVYEPVLFMFNTARLFQLPELDVFYEPVFWCSHLVVMSVFLLYMLHIKDVFAIGSHKLPYAVIDYRFGKIPIFQKLAKIDYLWHVNLLWLK